jgi:ATP-dependent helicase/nuclease subunit A
MKPTQEQRAAIETIDRALLVDAGAGTGKTRVLVERFLYLLGQHSDWTLDGIVAVTFTEKAAREMRTRIRKALEARAGQSPSDPLWQARRRDLDRLQVSTIHGLCARILRENAIPAGLDPQFGVLDENQADLLKVEAVEQALAELALGEEIGKEGLDLLTSLRVSDLRDLMVELLKERGAVAKLFAELPIEDDLLARWTQELTAMRADLWQDQLRDPDFRRVLGELPQVVISDPLDKLAPAVQYAQEGIRLVETENIAGACRAWDKIGLVGGKADAWGGKDLVKELREDLKRVREGGRWLIKSGVLEEIGEADRQAARSLQQWKALWDGGCAVYKRLKAERYALDFDDLELLTGQLLAQQPRAERLQAFVDGIRHLMVDEFQDTNQAQQQIVYALAHPGDAGRLFVVGDAKQSIYRFRQAQVGVFNRTAQDIQRLSGFPPAPLSGSFRTHAALVAALNDLFERLLQPIGDRHQDFEARPGPLRPQRPSPDDRPPVELLLLPAKKADDAKVNAEEARILEARLLAERLLDLQASAFPVWDKDENRYRPFRFDDAALLFRSTSSLALYEEQFKALGLPYLTISGRGYFDRPEVRALIALLACLYTPLDDLNLAAALRSALFNLNDETLYLLRWHKSGQGSEPDALSDAPIPYQQALRQPPATDQADAIAFAAQVLNELWKMAGRAPVWSLLRTALDRTGLEAALALNDLDRANGGRQRSNLVKFLNLARQDGSANLSAFLRTLDDLRANEAREGEGPADAPESGAVQVMTIHASKGLEFPVVAVADLGREKNKAGSVKRLLHDPAFGLACMVRDVNGDWQKPAGFFWADWLNKRMDAAESKRLLYVACTRAADLLLLSGKTGVKDTWMEEIQAMWEIADEGDAEEILERDGFRLRIDRRPYREYDGAVERAADAAAQAPGLEEMPALALPLTLTAWNTNQAIPVTSLARLLAAQEEGDSDEDNGLTLRPLIRPERAASGPVPAFLVGRVIHRVLADWACLALPAAGLARRIEICARREGLRADAALAFALQRCERVLADLRASELYAQICCARRRYHEIPFTWTARVGVLNGVIDLLFEDERGSWHLIDWKSEFIQHAQMQEHAHQHALQVAVYAQAAQTILGERPDAALCFLTAGARVWRYTQQDLDAAMGELV